ncbi:hypothetical protein DV738_g2546, partial [Chaetothyriales sp. CBS 135597]
MTEVAVAQPAHPGPSSDENTTSVDEIKTVFHDVNNFNVTHPLLNTWSLWFTKPPSSKGDNWNDLLKEVVTFDTVEEFWGVYVNLAVKSDYHLFKKGVKPEWEDPQNKHGGKWSYSYKDKKLINIDELWLHAQLAAIGETLEDEGDNEVMGVVVNVRKGFYRIGLWTRTTGKAGGKDALMKIGARFKEVLQVGNNDVIEFSGHTDAAHAGSTRAKAKYTADVQTIAEAFISKFASRKPSVRKQLIDANQLRIFSLTLHRPYLWPGSPHLEELEPVEGTPVPAAYHWAYFNPVQLQQNLSSDGTYSSFNPDSRFTRRMWAGGSISWPGANPSQKQQHHLKVGDMATEITSFLNCEVKTIRKTGESMLVIGVRKELRDSKDNLCVIDNRSWLFREAHDPSVPVSVAKKPAELSTSELNERDKGKAVREINRDEVQLFRKWKGTGMWLCTDRSVFWHSWIFGGMRT